VQREEADGCLCAEHGITVYPFKQVCVIQGMDRRAIGQEDLPITSCCALEMRILPLPGCTMPCAPPAASTAAAAPLCSVDRRFLSACPGAAAVPAGSVRTLLGLAQGIPLTIAQQ
jgi:hypothetical protein